MLAAHNATLHFTTIHNIFTNIFLKFCPASPVLLSLTACCARRCTVTRLRLSLSGTSTPKSITAQVTLVFHEGSTASSFWGLGKTPPTAPKIIPVRCDARIFSSAWGNAQGTVWDPTPMATSVQDVSYVVRNWVWLWVSLSPLLCSITTLYFPPFPQKSTRHLACQVTFCDWSHKMSVLTAQVQTKPPTVYVCIQP